MHFGLTARSRALWESWRRMCAVNFSTGQTAEAVAVSSLSVRVFHRISTGFPQCKVLMVLVLGAFCPFWRTVPTTSSCCCSWFSDLRSHLRRVFRSWVLDALGSLIGLPGVPAGTGKGGPCFNALWANVVTRRPYFSPFRWEGGRGVGFLDFVLARRASMLPWLRVRVLRARVKPVDQIAQAGLTIIVAGVLSGCIATVVIVPKKECSTMARPQQYPFTDVPQARIERSSFSRSHGHKTTINAGWLVPLYVDEVLPGDTFNVKLSVFARLATPIVPLMDNLYLDAFFFFVPNRLVWDNWKKFCGEQDTPGASTDYLVPQVPITYGASPTPEESDSHLLFNYMGVPQFNMVTPGGVITINNLHGRAYNLIWNEFFRDENLQVPAVVDKDDGPDTYSDYRMRSRGKRHDYFTSCLPWPQKDVGVQIPISGVTPLAVESGGSGSPTFSVQGTTGTSLAITPNAGVIPFGVYNTGYNSGDVGWPILWANPALQVDPANAGTINSLRQAFQIQKLLERDARGGTRYVELLKSHFGVTSPDFRLQRPEYLGGGSVPVVINPVPQSSGSPQDTGGYTTTPQGHLAAYGVAAGSRMGFVKSFTEHGVLLGLVSIRADLNYQQGLPRMFQRRTKFDFYWPALAHLGEQAVLNREIYCLEDGVPSNDGVFGYQERWAEYRFYPGKITQQFQSGYPQSLDVWHLAEDFSAVPTLGESFIVSKPPLERVIAVPSEPHFILDSYFDIKAARPMPLYSVPGLVDHF